MGLTVRGVFLIDKPAEMTSHDVVGMVRRLTGERRVGHAGTLDPFATGLLLVAVGAATRLLSLSHDWSKTYDAVLRLGVTSTTDDRTGVLTTVTAPVPSAATVQAVLARFVGPLAQQPPAYAAVKVQGTKLYELARVDVEAAAAVAATRVRSVTIHELTLLAYDYPWLSLRVTCSTGTYIRSLARDIGATLGVGAHVTMLRRTHSGPLAVASAWPVTTLAATTWPVALRSPTLLLSHLPRLTLSPSLAESLSHGQRVQVPHDAPITGRVALFLPNGALLGIGAVDDRSLSPTVILPPDYP